MRDSLRGLRKFSGGLCPPVSLVSDYSRAKHALSLVEGTLRTQTSDLIFLSTRCASAVKAAESGKGTGNFFRKKVASPLPALFSSLRTLRLNCFFPVLACEAAAPKFGDSGEIAG